ncbi:hypothetical protein DM01DRAFT_1164931 [Hesseltinella vesiculosa]|uniref:Cas12f1-like TNB domain-containing protein n=1 Tax=Hesseltinella vesiculosa TaxID=101127 RepID=A0A1X2GT84_9FUNG|nr:hypothetical protein DM01DRAFT_1164931 [Hesseltinella vesiculosa]
MPWNLRFPPPKRLILSRTLPMSSMYYNMQIPLTIFTKTMWLISECAITWEDSGRMLKSSTCFSVAARNTPRKKYKTQRPYASDTGAKPAVPSQELAPKGCPMSNEGKATKKNGGGGVKHIQPFFFFPLSFSDWPYAILPWDQPEQGDQSSDGWPELKKRHDMKDSEDDGLRSEWRDNSRKWKPLGPCPNYDPLNLVVFGNGWRSFGRTAFRSCPAGLAKRAYKVFKAAAVNDLLFVAEINEHNTSKKCSRCWGELECVQVKSTKLHSVQACKSCRTVWSRDKNSANNIHRLSKYYIRDRKLPPPFQKPSHPLL